MKTANPYQSYQNTQIETADHLTLVLMLYDGALKFMGRGRQAILEENPAEANRCLGRAQDIVSELMGSINPHLKNVAANLISLYDYLYYLLLEANIKKDVDTVAKAEELLRSMRRIWK